MARCMSLTAARRLRQGDTAHAGVYPAEEFALNESMGLYGFIGAIVRDQFGAFLTGINASESRGSAGWVCRIPSPMSGTMPTRSRSPER